MAPYFYDAVGKESEKGISVYRFTRKTGNACWKHMVGAHAERRWGSAPAHNIVFYTSDRKERRVGNSRSLLP